MIRSTICVLAASAIGLAAAAPCHLYEPNVRASTQSDCLCRALPTRLAAPSIMLDSTMVSRFCVVDDLFALQLETPCFTQLKNTSAYEVRSYADSSPEFWTMATIHSDSFAVAQSEGFHQNFDVRVLSVSCLGVAVDMPHAHVHKLRVAFIPSRAASESADFPHRHHSIRTATHCAIEPYAHFMGHQRVVQPLYQHLTRESELRPDCLPPLPYSSPAVHLGPELKVPKDPNDRPSH